jgi:hypothetical protein
MGWFSPERKRKHLLDPDIGALSFIERNYESLPTENLSYGMLSAGTDALYCRLVGLEYECHTLAAWASHLISNDALKRDLTAVGPSTEARLRETLGLFYWILENPHWEVEMARAATTYAQFYRHFRPCHDRVNLGLGSPRFLCGNAFQTLLELLPLARGTSPPRLPSDTRGEFSVAYAVCLHHVEGLWDREAIRTAVERLIRREMDRWLVDGHVIRATEWMMYLHRDEKLAPSELLSRCLPYLPDSHKLREVR